MAQQVRGVIAPGKDEPVRVETIVVPDPGPGEAVVKVQACGVCHTDLHYSRAASTTTSRSCSATRRPASSSRSATGVTDVAPGDFVDPQLACGVRPVPRLPARAPLVLLRHPQRAAEDDAARTAPSCRPALGIGAFAEKTLVAAGQCTKVDPAVSPGRRRPARLRRDGRHRRRHQHRRGRPRRHRRRHRLRRRRRRGDRRRPAGRRGEDHRRRHRRPQAGDRATKLGATHTVNSRGARPGRGHPRAHRRHSAPTSSSRRSAARRRTSRPSTPATSPAPSSSSACPPPRCSSNCRCSTSSAAAARSSRPGTATACPRATSRCSSTCTCRAASTSARS